MKMSDVLGFIESPEDFDVFYQGKKVTYLDEVGRVTEDSKFFAAGFEFGAHVIVHVESYHGDGFETAYEAWIDSLPEIEKSEYVEAYAPSGESDSFYDLACREIEAPAVNYPWNEYREKRLARARELLDAAVAKAREEGDNWPELIEGYREDSSGHVKSVGHYEWMNEADLDDIEIVRRDAAAEDAAE